MATAVLFIGWNGPRAGLAREARAYLEAYGLPYLQSLQLEGCERIEASSLAEGSLKGRAFLFGERCALDRVGGSERFRAFTRDMARYFEHVAIAQGISHQTWPSVRRPRCASAHSSAGSVQAH
jgi:hypothetical protein